MLCLYKCIDTQTILNNIIFNSAIKCLEDELAGCGSQSIDLPIDKTAKLYYVSCFKKAYTVKHVTL